MIPNEQELMDNLGKISYMLDKAYLTCLERDYYVLPFDEKFNKDGMVSYVSNVRALRLKRCVIDKEEMPIDCFKNVLGLFEHSKDSLALVIKRTPKDIEMYFVVKNIGMCRNADSKANIELLAESIRGNFPGTEVAVINEKNDGKDTEALFNFDTTEAVSILSNIPSEKSKEFISQGIEKLLNGVVPQSDENNYFIVVLAESIPMQEVRSIISGYEDLATAIIPFSGYQFQSGENKTYTQGEMESLSNSEGISKSITKTHSVNVAIKGLSTGYTSGTTDTESKTDTNTKGTNHSISIGSSDNTTYTYKSYLVSDLITNLETTIKRICNSKANGLWKYAAYVFSNNTKMTVNVANFLRSIFQGDYSNIEPAFVQTFIKENSNGVTPFGEVQKYVKHFTHPVFYNPKDGIMVTPTSEASTAELANVFAFPRHSVDSLPVIECIRFGREPHSLVNLAKNINLGCAYHMHQEDVNLRVYLSKEELTKHTFITGSTGSGKSNAVYKLLEELCPNKTDATKFLVIEPAKGEYKDVFGGRDDVTVYGTNPFKVPNLLQINPFSFPDDIHVLEHIDRLVEVFNACWPMYAAMPAILKEAVEKAYVFVGWNLKSSKSIGVFPTFDTLMSILPNVIDSSAYSSDTSNDYKGALLTRVRSLTTGIYGQIFGLETDNKLLFNSNTILDISRIGSSETKALIMGILVLKLQEFRMSETSGRNNELKHITVLEEAHNLLRRTSAEQSQESPNLQGKSVEMLANAIAEMRTYGEGFIIVDQSPGLMDMSVIRNTNTKLILRLPDESDRVLVGKAAGLSDAQISELSRLKCGVAAILQSDWLEPVLCKVDEFTDCRSLSSRYKIPQFKWEDDESSALKQFWNSAFDVEHRKLSLDVVDKIRKWCDRKSINNKVRTVIERILDGDKLSGEQRMLLVGGLFSEKLRTIPDRETATTEVQKELIRQYDFKEQDEVIRRINDLFLTFFPANIYTDLARNTVKVDGSIR